MEKKNNKLDKDISVIISLFWVVKHIESINQSINLSSLSLRVHLLRLQMTCKSQCEPHFLFCPTISIVTSPMGQQSLVRVFLCLLAEQLKILRAGFDKNGRTPGGGLGAKPSEAEQYNRFKCKL